MQFTIEYIIVNKIKMVRFISFDPAVKTLGYIIVDIDPIFFDKNEYKLFNERKDKLLSIASSILSLSLINMDIISVLILLEKILRINMELVETLNKMRNMIVLEQADTIDLFPDNKCSEITCIMKIKAATVIMHQIKNTLDGDEIVLIEYQMADQAASIAHTIVSCFYDHEVHFVLPALKNKINVGDVRYSSICKRYSNSYSANKAHALANFILIKKYYTNNLSDLCNSTKAHEGHIADAFMQILAFIEYS